MSEGEHPKNSIGGIFREKKSILMIGGIIVIGVLLMLFGAVEGKQENPPDYTAYSDISDLEKRVKELCERIYGVSDVSVMITLDTFGEQMYAFNAQQSHDGENKNERLEYVTTSGGLVPTGELMPRIRGIAVVCRGGDDATVKLKLTEMLCALFSVSSDSVSIVGSK